MLQLEKPEVYVILGVRNRGEKGVRNNVSKQHNKS